MPELYALVVRELSSCCQNVSRFCGCCLLAMTDRDATLTLNMTMKFFACAIFVIASVSEAIKRIERPRRLIATRLTPLALTIKSKTPQKKRAQSYGEATAQPRFGFHNL